MAHENYVSFGSYGNLYKHTSTPEQTDLQLTALQQWRFNLINMYVTDALNTRAPNKKLECRFAERGLCGISIHTAYKMSHNSFWSLFVYTTIWIHLGIIFYEPWANMDITTRYPFYLYIMEGSILFIYLIDVYLHCISHDEQNYWNLTSTKIIIICIILSYIDIVSSVVIRFLSQQFIIRIACVLRPMFLVTRSQFLRATCVSIFNSIPNILDVLFLVCLYILMFAVLGFVLFSPQQMAIGVHVTRSNAYCNDTLQDTDCDFIQDSGNMHFNTIYESYLSLCVLMSTANFPDVMMSSFHANKVSGIFFIAFIAFGIYYLMSIIFAVIYHHYHQDNAHFVRILTNNRAKSLDAAFKQLIILSKELSFPSHSLEAQKLNHINFNSERVYFFIFQQFLIFRRKNLCIRRARILYNALCEARSRTEAVKCIEDEGLGISRKQWQNLYKFVNVNVFRDPSYAVEYMIKQGKNNILFSLILGDENVHNSQRGCCQRVCYNRIRTQTHDHDCCFQLIREIYYTWLRLRGLLYSMFTHKVISKIIDLFVWIGTMLLIYELQCKESHPIMQKVSDILIIIFLVEVTLRFIAFGSFFLKDLFNIIDFVVVYTSVLMVMDLFPNISTNSIVAFRLLRFVRALSTIERFKLIISTSVTVLKKVGVLFTLEFCVFYVFAVIGVYCYSGVVTKQSALQMLHDARDRGDIDNRMFWEYVRDNWYFDNNMNYFSNALMVMVELTVVNQWHAITRMYAQLTSPYTYLYFYAFYFVSVLIVMNLCTAFIFEAFIIQFQAARTQQIELNKKKARHPEIEKRQKRKKEKRIQRQMKKNKKKILSNHNSIQLTRGRANSLSSVDESIIGERLFSYGANKTDEDVLDDYIKDLNESDVDDWHKWIAIAMLYEFDTDDVIKGVWLYFRDKTTADFYEQIYGEVTVEFDEYLKDWNESIEDSDNNSTVDDNDNEIDDNNSALGIASNTSMTSSSTTYSRDSSQSIRGSGKDIFITRQAIKAKTMFEKTRASALSIKDRYGNIDQVNIEGPKQKCVYSALSTAPQVGFAPVIKAKQVNKVTKLLDLYVSQTHD